MKNNIIEIYGEEFVLKNGDYEPIKKYENILEAYEKPSKIKKEIWNYWMDWFINSSDGKDDFISIRGRNVYHFSINGIITVKDVKYSFCITKQNKLLYLQKK